MTDAQGLGMATKPSTNSPGLPHQIILVEDTVVDRLEAFFAGTDLDAELREIQATMAERAAKAAARKARRA